MQVRTTLPIEEMFVTYELEKALFEDEKEIKNAMTSLVKTVEDIESKRDAISFKKSASVLRMLKYLVTNELFNLSLRDYLTSNM